MFDIGWTELLVIAVVAILVVGPKDLPAMLRSLGRYAGKLRRTAGEFRAQFEEALRESELDELRSTMHDVSRMNPVNQIRDSVNESLDPLKKAGDDIKRHAEGYDGAGGSGGASDPSNAATAAPEALAAATPAATETKKKAAAKPSDGGGLRKKHAAKAKTTSTGTGV